VVEIVNADGKVIASRTIGFPQGFYAYVDPASSNGEIRFAVPVTAAADFVFPSVDPNDMTQTMAICIASINGQSAETWARANRLSILTKSDYQKTAGLIPLLERTAEERRNERGENISFRVAWPRGATRNTPVTPYHILELITTEFQSSLWGWRSIEHPDRTVWQRTRSSTTGPNGASTPDGFRFYVIHHGAAAPQDIAGPDGNISIYPSTTKSFSGNYEFTTGGPSTYLPVSNISVPVGAFLGRSIYLGANLTLTNIDQRSRSQNHPLIDVYNKNGKKEGWYVYNSYTNIQWSTLGVAHTDMYTCISQTGNGAYYVQERINYE
jgi:hypothetical protein